MVEQKSKFRNSASAVGIIAPRIWNRLPDSLRQNTSNESFKIGLKTHLFKLAFGELHKWNTRLRISPLFVGLISLTLIILLLHNVIIMKFWYVFLLKTESTVSIICIAILVPSKQFHIIHIRLVYYIHRCTYWQTRRSVWNSSTCAAVRSAFSTRCASHLMVSRLVASKMLSPL